MGDREMIPESKIIAALKSDDNTLYQLVKQDFQRVYFVAYRYYHDQRIGPFTGEKRIFRVVVDQKAG